MTEDKFKKYAGFVGVNSVLVVPETTEEVQRPKGLAAPPSQDTSLQRARVVVGSATIPTSSTVLVLPKSLQSPLKLDGEPVCRVEEKDVVARSPLVCAPFARDL